MTQEQHPAPFRMPPITHTADGKMRRVGFELEFTGLSLEETASILQRALGGKLHTRSSAERHLEVEGLGTFNIELDWDYLKRTAAEAENGERDREWTDLLSQAAHLVVPLEVVCPPLPLDQLPALHALVEGLRQAGAQGTDDSPIAAYGVHINPEIGTLDVNALHDYLRSFALLQWWLAEAHALDLARRISPYIDLYPDSYLKALLSERPPSMVRLISDYLTHNPTRNRGLDLLPLLTQIDAQQVRLEVDDPKVKARPAFHYRLPNSHVERPGWSLADEWNRWWVVESLAQRPAELDRLSRSFISQWRPVLGVNRRTWQEYMASWLNDHGLV